jgi:hypothetical protein
MKQGPQAWAYFDEGSGIDLDLIQLDGSPIRNA